LDPIIDVFDRTVEETLEQKLDNLLNVFEASPIDLTNLEQIGQKPSRELIVPAGRSLIILNNRITQIFRQNPELLRTIDPFTFERVIAELFQEEGYEVALTPPRVDGGKDIYVYKTDPLTKVMFLVECKRYAPTNKVDVTVARQLYGVVQQERASGGIIVTTSFFTKPAKEFAASVPYQLFLRDYDYLVQWFKKPKQSR
jgi:restriction endonuclease Mrr